MLAFHLRRRTLLLTIVIVLFCLLVYLLYRRKEKIAVSSSGLLNEAEQELIVQSENVAVSGAITIKDSEFYLEGKPIKILSGALHYFRVVPECWRDRLLKLKALGLNTVETYVPWNLHEEIKGHFKFDGNLDFRRFILLAKELELLVIVRPGPYICSEWEFGGLPSWLLRDPKMAPRTMYGPYIEAVEQYFKTLLPLLVPLQYSKGGPIIAFQIENEYGMFPHPDPDYMKFLKLLMISEGITELLFTSDGASGVKKDHLTLPNVLQTINFGVNSVASLENLKKVQPNMPCMVAEFWLGWFDHWHERHHVSDPKIVADSLAEILQFGASFNLYMFHGGTNFGFMNGANKLFPTVTSYDYDAPLSEAGDITPKYQAIRNVIWKYALISNNFPPLPENLPKEAYGKVLIQHRMSFEKLLQYHNPIESESVMTMEELPINNNGGQGYGFVLYHTELAAIPKQISMSKVLDRAQVFLDSVLIHVSDVSTGEQGNVRIQLVNEPSYLPKTEKHTLRILVENMGRTNFNFDLRFLRKGIQGQVMVDEKKQMGWKIVPLEFKADVLSRLKGKENWDDLPPTEIPEGPSLYRATLVVQSEPKDTFLHMKGWTKGVCFINGHNLGRYWNVGPQMTLYVPGPWLRKGENEIIIFELHRFEAPELSFVNFPILEG